MPLPSYPSNANAIGDALVADCQTLFSGRDPFTAKYGPVDKRENLLYPLWRFLPHEQHVLREGNVIIDQSMWRLAIEYQPGGALTPPVLASVQFRQMLDDLELWLNHWGSASAGHLGGAAAKTGHEATVQYGYDTYTNDLNREVIGAGVLFRVMGQARSTGP